MLVRMIDRDAFKAARKAKGLSQGALAKRAGVAQQLIGQLERGDVRSTKAIYKIADALGVPANQLDTEIPESEEAPQRMIPVVGFVGAGAQIWPIDDHAKGAGLDEVECPWTALPLSTVAVRVRGDSMAPAYYEGDLLFYDTQHADILHLVGKECVVALADGQIFIKELRRTGNGDYYLHSHNAEPIIGPKIKWAAKVKLIQRAG